MYYQDTKFTKRLTRKDIFSCIFLVNLVSWVVELRYPRRASATPRNRTSAARAGGRARCPFSRRSHARMSGSWSVCKCVNEKPSTAGPIGTGRRATRSGRASAGRHLALPLPLRRGHRTALASPQVLRWRSRSLSRAANHALMVSTPACVSSLMPAGHGWSGGPAYAMRPQGGPM